MKRRTFLAAALAAPATRRAQSRTTPCHIPPW
jgi:hypothetical protein